MLESCRMRTLAMAILSVAIGAWPEGVMAQGSGSISLEQLRAMREQAKQRQRRVIYNNDGGDVIIGWDGPATADKLIDQRTRPLVGTHVDSLFYSTGGRSFDGMRHATKVGRVADSTEVVEGYTAQKNNKVGEFIAQGTDALKIMVEFGHQQKWEVVCSFRMNDVHDGGEAVYADLVRSPWKDQHSELLVGSKDKQPPYGAWTSVNYAEAAVRDRMFSFVEEVCRNYDLDGVELDFFRHPCFFKSSAWGQAATAEELEAMTELIRRIRRMTEEEGMKRGRPLLLAIRVPDSLEFNRAIGLDVEKWLAENLVDLMTVSCYFKLNRWQVSAELGHKYGVKVYAGLSDVRGGGGGPPTVNVARRSVQAYFARAMLAHAAGMDGIYLFNLFNVQKEQGLIPRFVGDPKLLARQSKVYFDEYRGFHRVKNWINDPEKYIGVKPVFPETPMTVQPGQAGTIQLEVGETVSEQLDEKTTADVRLRLWIEGLTGADQVNVTFSGTAIKPSRNEFFVSWRIQWNDDEKRKQALREQYAKKGLKETEGWLELAVDPALVKQGVNPIQVQVGSNNPTSAVVRDVALWITYKTQK